MAGFLTRQWSVFAQLCIPQVSRSPNLASSDPRIRQIPEFVESPQLSEKESAPGRDCAQGHRTLKVIPVVHCLACSR